jgi:serine/threonine-protein kinase
VGVRLLESESGVGTRIDRYDLVAELASGGMATVFLARLSAVGGFQRTFAIKRLHPHLATNADFVNMFLDEARLAALIRHPNVVPILEVGQGGEGYYLVMEYIEGDTFASVLSKTSARGQRIPIPITLRIIHDLLLGLHAAHELKDEHGHVLGLVHRDVSPQNVMVGTDGITRITDFGVARAASALSQTKAGQLKGKLAYMAPEQASGREDVDRRVDVFAAGVVLWEALAFKRLFKANTEAVTLSRVLSEPVVSPQEHNPDCSDEVAAVCLKALERDVNHRFVSCAEFAAALERAAASSGQLASVSEVGEFVKDVVGSDVESHRVAIRRWLELREQAGIRASSIPSPPSPELSSVTMTSRMPPLSPAASQAPRAASATHSGVIVTPASRRRPAFFAMGAVLLCGAGALAYLVDTGTDQGSPEPASSRLTPEPTVGRELDVTATTTASASESDQASAAPTVEAAQTTGVAARDPSTRVLSSDELPEATEDPSPPGSAEPPKARRTWRRPAKKAKQPDLDNPYQ